MLGNICKSMNDSTETTAFAESSSLYGTDTSESSSVTWSAGSTFSGSATTTVTDTTSSFSANINETTTHIYDTYSVFVHPHWQNFPHVSDHWHYIVGVFLTLVHFVGIIGNSLVILIFTSEKSLRTSSNMFIVNLAISDFSFSIVIGFPLISLSAFNKRWLFGQTGCEIYAFVAAIFGLMSINNMATIAIDRYYAIARPLNVAKFMTKKKALLMIVAVWIWSVAVALPPVLGWSRYILEGFQTSCTFDYLTRTDNNRSYILFLYVFGFILPLALILVCYALIVRAVKLHEDEMKKIAKRLNAEMRTNQDKKSMEIKVAKVAMTILVLFLISWLPYAIVALIGQFGDASYVTPFLAEIPVVFAKSSAMYNPIVYALSHPKFRTALQTRFPRITSCCTPEAKSPAPSSVACDNSEVINLDDPKFIDTELGNRKLDEEQENKTLPSNIVKIKSSDLGSAKDGVFVPESNTLPEFGNNLAKHSTFNNDRSSGVSNEGMETSSETPLRDDVGAYPKTTTSDEDTKL